MSKEFFVFGKGRWCAIDISTGQCEGLRRWSFGYQRDGKVVLANKQLVIRGLRALAEGKPSTVQDCRVIESRKYPFYNTERSSHYSKKNRHSRCCCNKRKKHDTDEYSDHYKKENPNILKDLRNVGIQVTQTLENKKLDNASENIRGLKSVESRRHMKRKRESSPDETKNVKKPSKTLKKDVVDNRLDKESIQNVKKYSNVLGKDTIDTYSENEPSQSILKQSKKSPVKNLKHCKDLKALYLKKKRDKANKIKQHMPRDYKEKIKNKYESSEEEKGETESENSDGAVKVLSINDNDIRVLWKFFSKHPSDVNAKRFSLSDQYKKEILYKFNPLVEVQRCNFSNFMNIKNTEEELSLKQFATKLELRSMSDVEEERKKRKEKARKRYKFRNKKTTVSSAISSEDTDPDYQKLIKDITKETKSVKSQTQKHLQKYKSSDKYQSRKQENLESSSVSEESSDDTSVSNSSAVQSDHKENNMTRKNLLLKNTECNNNKKKYYKTNKEVKKNCRKEKYVETSSGSKEISNKANKNENHVKGRSLQKNLNKSNKMFHQPVKKRKENQISSDIEESSDETNKKQKLHRKFKKPPIKRFVKPIKNVNEKRKHKVNGTSSLSEESCGSAKENIVQNAKKFLIEKAKWNKISSDTEDSTNEWNKNENAEKRQQMQKCKKNIPPTNKKFDKPVKAGNEKRKPKVNVTLSDNEESSSSNKETIVKKRPSIAKIIENIKEVDSEFDVENKEGNKRMTRKRKRDMSSRISIVISDDEEANESEKSFIESESEKQVKKNAPTVFKPSMNKVGVIREYSALEDHAIVAWLSVDERRPRQVNGNRIWKKLEPDFPNLTGQKRSWHSLRNRYLRYILPALGTFALPLTQVSTLRAAAAQGEIKSSQKGNKSLQGKPTAVSAWSRRAKQPLSDNTLVKSLKQTPEKRALRSSTHEASSTSPQRQLPASPTYSEVTTAFAARHRVATSTPSIGDRSIHNNEVIEEKNTSKRKSKQDNQVKKEKQTSRIKSKHTANVSKTEDKQTHKSRRLYNPSAEM